eukprot:scaffold4470_cov255-Prasinococcus_capsulatus_cf.AAC.8
MPASALAPGVAGFDGDLMSKPVWHAGDKRDHVQLERVLRQQADDCQRNGGVAEPTSAPSAAVPYWHPCCLM